ncbi:MAG: molybdenum cofactor guanylyltransferase [Cyanobacteria bacterium J06638_7]
MFPDVSIATETLAAGCAAPASPLRCCLLSGGQSRRMGRDKALLAHPRGGTWLEATLLLLAELGAPITLLSGHGQHISLATRLAPGQALPLTAIREPLPHEGPLLALGRLMEAYPGARLLLCPVDMPALTLPCLQRLLEVSLAAPALVHVAHDGRRAQPLLGVYPASPGHRSSLAATLGAGGRALRLWLDLAGCIEVPLPASALRNVNRPGDLALPNSPA